MPEEATAPVVDQAGISRTPDGTLAATPAPTAAESTPSTTPSTTPAPAPKEGATLLNQEAPKEEPKAPEGAPEKYEDFKVPEGFTLDAEVATEAGALFKGMGLSQENAQKLVDFYVKETQDAVNAPYEAYRQMTDKWKSDAESHPDLRGKLGPGQEVNVRIGKFLSALPDQQLASDFRALMDLTGAGNHPAFIRVLDHAARLGTEGGHVAGGKPSALGQTEPGRSAAPDAAAALWPTLPRATR